MILSEKRSVFSMPLLYGIARGDCLYLFCFCASLPHMSIRARIVVSVALQEVDNAPNAKTCSESDNKCLQNAYCAVENAIIKLLSAALRLPEKGIKNGGQFSITAAVISPRAA